jgi:hypothetical protein
MTSPFFAEIPGTTDDEVIANAIRSHLTQIWSAMPAIVAKDTTDGHIAQLQIAVNGTVIDGDGKKTNPAYPLIDDVPIHHHGGGKNVHTMPVVKGDETLVVFSSRPHDTWHQNGGTENNPIDSRTHHMSDGFTIRGYRSDPRKIKNVSNVSAQNRSEDGKHTHDVHPVNGITTKSVDKDDKADNPWKDAKKYFQSFVLGQTGVYHQAVDGNTTHQSTVDHNQITHSLKNGQHSITLDSVANTIVHSLFNGQHKIKLGSGGIDSTSNAEISHSAPSVSLTGSNNTNITAPQNNINGNTNIAGNTNISGILSALGGISGGGGGGISGGGAVTGSSVAVTGAVAGATIQTTGFTVASLNAAFPPASNVGMRAYVTDSVPAPAFLSTLTGGGSVVCPAFCNGVAWVAG